MSDIPRTDGTSEVPLIELMRKVPKSERTWVEREGEMGSHNVPYGHMLHQAADRIELLERELAKTQREADEFRGWRDEAEDEVIQLRAEVAELERQIQEHTEEGPHI